MIIQELIPKFERLNLRRKIELLWKYWENKDYERKLFQITSLIYLKSLYKIRDIWPEFWFTNWILKNWPAVRVLKIRRNPTSLASIRPMGFHRTAGDHQHILLHVHQRCRLRLLNNGDSLHEEPPRPLVVLCYIDFASERKKRIRTESNSSTSLRIFEGLLSRNAFVFYHEFPSHLCYYERKKTEKDNEEFSEKWFDSLRLPKMFWLVTYWNLC